MSNTAIVTGSSSGIGLRTAVELARRGYDVVATMRDLERRGRLEAAAAAAGVSNRLQLVQLDITDFKRIPVVVSDVLRDHGRIDVLVNNAGFVVAGFAEDISLAELRQQFETNFFGHVATTRAVLPAMRAQRSGHVIMLSSILGLAGEIAVSSYSASKFALEGWSESLRLEIFPLGIRVVLVEPGAYETDGWERNVRLGERTLEESSAYREHGRRIRDQAQKIKKRDPREVARLIARIAADPNPRLRYRVGVDAHLQCWLRQLLPWKRYERLVARIMGTA